MLLICSHYIAEIRAYWLETKPSEIDNPRHHSQITWQRCLCLCSRGGKIFWRFLRIAWVEKLRVWASGWTDDNSTVRRIMKRSVRNKNRPFFNVIELLLWFKTPRARQRSENPTPKGKRMCESPGVTRGDGQVWNWPIHKMITHQNYIVNVFSTSCFLPNELDNCSV